MINEEPNYWPRYSIKDHYRLRHNFSESEKIKKNWSQSMQDMFVLSMLDGKRNGVYVEIGADKPKIINNTYLLETQFDWIGVSFELDSEKVEFYNDFRKNTCICGLDDIWQKESTKIFEKHGYERVIKNVANQGNPYEDWWVDPKVVNRAIIEKFAKTDDWSRESTECIFSNTQFSIMPIVSLRKE